MKEEAHDFTRGRTGSPERSQEQCIDHYVESIFNRLRPQDVQAVCSTKMPYSHEHRPLSTPSYGSTYVLEYVDLITKPRCVFCTGSGTQPRHSRPQDTFNVVTPHTVQAVVRLRSAYGRNARQNDRYGLIFDMFPSKLRWYNSVLSHGFHIISASPASFLVESRHGVLSLGLLSQPRYMCCTS